MPRKRSIEDLALFGGAPRFEEPRHVGRPNLPDRATLLRRIEGCLDRRWLSNDGPLVRELEARVAAMLDVEHCVAVSNATVGLGLVARALELTGEVIVPAFTFVATAHAMRWHGLQPVFCDIDPATHDLDVREVEKLVTPATSAIVGVHVWGRPCDTAALEALAARRGLRLFFDAAHAFGCQDRGRPVGAAGEAEVFSLHATKFVQGLEGGLVTTRSATLARRLRAMRNFGFEAEDAVGSLGTNAKMDELSAAMALGCLDEIEDIVELNRGHHRRYRARLDPLPGIELMGFDDVAHHHHQHVVTTLVADRTPLRRDTLHALLCAEGVLARRYFHPGCHRSEPYASEQPDLALPHTEALCDRVLCLPTGQGVGAEDVDAIGDLIAFALAEAEAIERALEARGG